MHDKEPGRYSLNQTRPMRVVNKWAYRCSFNLNVASFYASELGVDPETLERKHLKTLGPEQWQALRTSLVEGFKVLLKNSTITPQSLYLSCTKFPNKHRNETELQYLQRMDSPYFTLLLNRYLPSRIDGHHPRSSVLSLGCGVDLEAQTLRQYFLATSTDSIHVGIDKDSDKLADACTLNPSKDNYHYVCGDLEKETTHQEISQKSSSFDLLVMRHAPVWQMGGIWYRSLERYSDLLNRDGYLLMTFHFDEEFDEVAATGLPPCFDIVAQERNRARAYNHRLYTNTLVLGALQAFSDTSNTQDSYLLWLESQTRDNYVILAKKASSN